MTSASFSPDGASLLQVFAGQCALSPAHIAVQQGDAVLSYRQLDSLSSQVAQRLQTIPALGTRPVALFCDRSIHVVVAMLGCLKHGVPFVPIDPQLPDTRVIYMLDDADVAIMLVDDQWSQRAHELLNSLCGLDTDDIIGINTLCSDGPAASSDSANAVQPVPRLQSNPLAYIMYTSGSTGQPKGVAISRQALQCYCEADAQVYRLTGDDRTLQFSTLSFDISIEEIFPPLITGGTVVLRPASRGDAQNELSDIVKRERITALHLATGYWHEWVNLMHTTGDEVPASIRLMVVTGEKVSPEHYALWQQICPHEVLWANAYGPTEATVSATVFIPPAGWQGNSLPIGTALPGYRAYILDDQRQPVADGQTGELYIGGNALADGYLNKPELTARAFVPDPVVRRAQTTELAVADAQSNPRMYRTGDLARWLDQDTIAYAGRIDHQVKLGSYRVEPGEVENTLNDLDDIQDSLVRVDDNGAQQCLVAYIASQKSDNATVDTASTIKLQLSRSLPAYMVPSHYVFLPRFPKTLNGKVDRDALPDVSNAIFARDASVVAPSTPIEQVLCDIWQQILGVAQVSIHDSFLSLGGDSLLAVRAIADIQAKLEFTVSTRDFFFLDSIALLAGHIEGRQVVRQVPPPELFFINSRQRQLYGVTQAPQSKYDKGVGLLLVPSLGNEQRRCQRPFKGLMHKLARDGFHVSRFDWQGTGDSSGTTQHIRHLAPWIDDLRDAATRLSQSVDEIHLISVRFGAFIIALSDLPALPIVASYCWDPIASGNRWLSEMQTLQQGIRADTYRFLFARKARRDNLSEFAGLTLHPDLCHTIGELELGTLLRENAPTYPIHLMVADQSLRGTSFPPTVDLHVNCDENRWLDPRATTHDMKINRVAGITVDLIQRHSRAGRSVVDPRAGATA